MDEYRTFVKGKNVPDIVSNYPNMKRDLVPVIATVETSAGGVEVTTYKPDWKLYWEIKHKNKPELEQLVKVYGIERVNTLCIQDTEYVGLYSLMKRFKRDVAAGLFVFKDEKIYNATGKLLA